MISLNEVASLAGQLNAIMDDSEGGIYDISIYEGIPKISMDPDNFLSEFVEFEIAVTENSELIYPFKLIKEIDGAKFSCLLKPSEIVALEDTMPEQFQYISKKLQEEN